MKKKIFALFSLAILSSATNANTYTTIHYDKYNVNNYLTTSGTLFKSSPIPGIVYFEFDGSNVTLATMNIGAGDELASNIDAHITTNSGYYYITGLIQFSHGTYYFYNEEFPVYIGD